MIKTEKQKYLFRCKECSAEFFFYIDETEKQDTTNEKDKLLWCVACIKQGTLVRIEKVQEKKFEYCSDNYR